MATAKVSVEQQIDDSFEKFDLNTPLTDEDLKTAGMLTVLPGSKRTDGMPLLQDIEDTGGEITVDAVAAIVDGEDYNVQYAHYLRCQALAALVAFDDGWKSFEEMILKTYVRDRKRENSEYRGDDPNKAFSLRIRQQSAEDFVKFIRLMIADAVATSKPSLAVKK